MKSVYGLAGLTFTTMLAGAWSCGTDRAGSVALAPASIYDSPGARARVEEIRARFRLVTAAPKDPGPGTTRTSQGPVGSRPVLGASVASGYELRDGYVRGLISGEGKQGAGRLASVELPTRASGQVRLEDDTSHVAVSFALRGALDMPVAVADGIAVYAGALAGADVIHRVHAEGTEDYIVFEGRPAEEWIAYDVDVSRVSGLRLVDDTLEFLDSGGAPRLRVDPPFLVDATGRRARATLTVDGCAFETTARAPWGRLVTAPRAPNCQVRVSWHDVDYPAVLDPNWTSTGSMTTPRSQQTAAILASGEVLISGGIDLFGSLLSAELYDPASGTFAATGSPTIDPVTATLLDSGEVLIVDDQSAEVYEPSAGVFAPTGSMTTERLSYTATLLGTGEVLVAGGGNPSFPALATAELYSPSAGTFAATGSMTTARKGHSATLLLTGEALLAGGGSSLTSAELYDPTSGTFTATGSMPTGRQLHTATLLASGEVLLAGGLGPLSSAEVYDPVAGTFSITGSMTTARWEQTATLLGSGEVLIAGGYSGGSLSSTELYDPVTGAFVATASMTASRSSQTATLLGSGQVLSAGGVGTGGSTYLSSAELFTCTTLTTCPAPDDCGTIAADCGGTVLTCGPACAAPETCGGGGTPNVCGCTPTVTSCPSGDDCGTVPNGCGGNVSCGPACTAPQTCGGGGTPNVCGCTPVTSCPSAFECGTIPDKCGGHVKCGKCEAGRVCKHHLCVEHEED